MKRYKVVNRKRFIAFISIVIVAFGLLISSAIYISSANEFDHNRCIEVEVQYGDTLWEIAKEYGNESKDIREIVYDICSINDIKASDLRPGQTILVPLD